jgi:hypothetical protein
MVYNIKDVCAGVSFIILGLMFGLTTLVDLDLGTAVRMGPGFFPLILSGILFLLGGVILFQSLNMTREDIGDVPWRGFFLILSAPVVFAFTVRGLGFVPAIVLVALMASLATPRMNALQRVCLVGAISVFCYLVFAIGLGLPVRAIGPWLGGY